MSKKLSDTATTIALEAIDSVRHKVVEQAWSGQEQTGYLQNIYGTDFTSQAAQDTNATSENSAEHTDADNGYVRFEPRPEEQAAWWHGEAEPRNAISNTDHAPHNGWSLGQDAWETRQTLEAEQDAPEQEQ